MSSKIVWQEDPPEVESGAELWWFYGNSAFERTRDKQELRLRMIKVGQNTFIHQNTFMYLKTEGWKGFWTPVEMPELPSL